jgi:hypothetical protein
MNGDDDIGDEVAGWSDNCNSSLAETDMDVVVENGGQGVADKRGEEDQRHNSVA